MNGSFKSSSLKPRRNNPELFEMLNKTEPFEVMAQPIVTSYTVNIDEDFDSVKQFENVVRVLDNARQGDIVEIKLSTNGGALHAILPLLAAISATEANVLVHAVSDVASAGTLVLLAADDVYVNPYVSLMFHQVQFGSAGSGSSVEAHVNHTIQSSRTLLEDYYEDFFSSDEIEAMLSGRDFYMGKEEFDERYDRRHEARKKKFAEAEEKLKAAADKPKKRGRKKVSVPEEV